jgi:catechol 2,3-dioxygenase-like lactoylglutathione lyase family enzyme
MYHPSHRVPDLAVAEEFFTSVFARPVVPLAAHFGGREAPAGYPTDYSIFTLLADVWFDCIDPDRYVIGGHQCYPSVAEPHLNGFGWGVEGIADLYRELVRRGIRCTDQLDRPWTGDDPPTAAFSSTPLFWTLVDDTGLRYELYPITAMGRPDPRSDPGWALGDPDPADPLGLRRCSHHTVLTERPERALALVVDVLGGTVVHEGENEALGARSTYVFLGDGILEYASALRPGTQAHADWAARAPLDTYHTLTFLVDDLDRVAGHLAACGVGIRRRDDVRIEVDPADALGVPWTFTTVSVPGDPRG